MIYLIRYDEIFLKSERTRRKLENILIDQIKKRIRVEKVLRERGRIIIETEENADEKLKYVFGISSFSKAIRLNSIEEVYEKIKEKVKDVRTFAVRVKRAVKRGKTSKELEEEIGEKILRRYPHLKVDLENPELTIFLEIRKTGIYLFFEKVKCFGGLPIGSEGKVVCLVSGGTDSVLASLLMMKRGCKTIILHGEMKDFWSEKARKRFEDSIEILKRFDQDLEVYCFNLYEIHRRIDIEEKLRCLFCKAMMYKAAEILCKEKKALGIVTGESIGQVASQTLQNLFYLSKIVDVPIFRPLCGFSKEEIKEVAKRFGILETTDIDVGRCKLVPKRPETRLKNFEVLKKKVEKGLKFLKIYEYD